MKHRMYDNYKKVNCISEKLKRRKKVNTRSKTTALINSTCNSIEEKNSSLICFQQNINQMEFCT